MVEKSLLSLAYFFIFSHTFPDPRLVVHLLPYLYY